MLTFYITIAELLKSVALTQISPMYFFDLGQNIGSHTAFSCHVFLFLSIPRQFISFPSLPHDLASMVGQLFCSVFFNLSLSDVYSWLGWGYVSWCPQCILLEGTGCLIIRDVNCDHSIKVASIRYLMGRILWDYAKILFVIILIMLTEHPQMICWIVPLPTYYCDVCQCWFSFSSILLHSLIRILP